MPSRRKGSSIVPIEEALDEFRAGRMIILMDDEDRENEGDLCVPAERVTAEHINFMATHGRGLVCLALTENRCDQLGLPMMVRENRAPLGTAFTVSINAHHGIRSGISAIDRATTIRTAIRPDAGPNDIVSPGHVFPLRARNGGVLVRAGQTEGVVDMARLAGLVPAGVICEIMNEDGSMARLPDLERFARAHGLKIATIADLIGYRSGHETLVHCIAEAPLNTRYGGEFRALVYRTDIDDHEHLVLVKGDVRSDEPILVRPHIEYLPGDIFGYRDRDTRTLLHRSMERIAAEGRGVILYLRRAGRGLDLFSLPDGGGAPPSTGFLSPRSSIFRGFGIGAQILHDIGVRKIRWLTNNPLRLVSLPAYGLEIVEWVPLTVSGVAASEGAGAEPRPESRGSKVLPLR
ncbi:MAG: 3,4-dihydroxy-2-butanone-4-phosphate synthase [Candidatus Binatia bacterium]